MKGKFKDGLVSIIMPVHNSERFVGEAIESVQTQLLSPDWELFVINDASTDRSLEIINSYAEDDERITIINLPENQGAAVARNAGIEAANGRWIAFLDSDDIWSKLKLSTQISQMVTNDLFFSYTNFRTIDEDGSTIKPEIENLPGKLDYEGLLKNTAMCCSTVVIDRNIIGDFRMPLVRKGQDTATWLMLMRERDVAAYSVDDVLTSYRQVEGSISSNKFGALKRTWYTYRELEKLPLHKAIYYFIHYVINAIKRRL